MADYERVPVPLYGEHEKGDILRQLDCLLDNPHFSHSKRFPSFLRFIVQEELEGRGNRLKERTLGIEVFGRHAGYDTASDPIVRVTAAEIRKRIAQYYQNTDNLDNLRLVPTFPVSSGPKPPRPRQLLHPPNRRSPCP